MSEEAEVHEYKLSVRKPFGDVLSSVLDECESTCEQQVQQLLRVCREATEGFGESSTVTLSVKFSMKEGMLRRMVVVTAQRPTAVSTENIKFKDACDRVNKIGIEQ